MGLSLLFLAMEGISFFWTAGGSCSGNQFNTLWMIFGGQINFVYIRGPDMAQYWGGPRQPNTWRASAGWNVVKLSHIDERILFPEHRVFSTYSPARIWEDGYYIPFYVLSLLCALPWCMPR